MKTSWIFQSLAVGLHRLVRRIISSICQIMRFSKEMREITEKDEKSAAKLDVVLREFNRAYGDSPNVGGELPLARASKKGTHE